MNAAAVETIRTGGELYTVDTPQLGGLGPGAALLRYSLGIF